MKKLLLIACAAILGLNGMAQNNVKFEGVVGMNIAKMDVYDSKPGFHIGVRGELALPSLVNGLYTNAGLLVSQKGAKLDLGDLGKVKLNAYYLELPIHIGYKYNLNEDFSLFGEFGPYFAFGLGGKHKVTELDFDYEGNETYNEYSYNTFDSMKRFDAGLGFRIGAEFKQKYTISLGYDFGLVNTWKGNSENAEDDGLDLTSSCKNKNFTISIGYKF